MRHEQRLPSRPTTKFLPLRRRPVSPHSQPTPSLGFRRVVNTSPKRSTEDSDSLRAVRRPNSLAPLGLQLGNDTGTGDMPASSSPTPILLAANHACGGGHGLGRVKQSICLIRPTSTQTPITPTLFLPRKDLELALNLMSKIT